MQAEKLILETDGQGQIKGLPTLPPNTSVEVILLFSQSSSLERIKRKPAPELAGQVVIKGDLLAPVAPEEEWNVMK